MRTPARPLKRRYQALPIGEVLLMPLGGQTSTQHAKWQPRCEFDHTLKGECCDKRGEVWWDGLLLCESHARKLEAQERIDLSRGIISCLELCLSNLTLRRDTNLVGLLRARRAGAARELELAHQELRQAAM
jgi:hypothetical protein